MTPMISLDTLYVDYANDTPDRLETLLLDALRKEAAVLPENSVATLKRAIGVATEYTNRHQKSLGGEKHKQGTVVRESGEPYVNHVLRVACILVHERILNLDALVAAVMHDLFEDTTYTPEQAKKDFGDEVAALIDCVTNVSTQIRDLRSQVSTKEEIDYAGIIRKCREHKVAFYIKFADRVDNLMTLGAKGKDKQRQKITETRKYILPLAKRLDAGRFLALLEDAIYRNERPTEYASVAKFVSDAFVLESAADTEMRIAKAFVNKDCDSVTLVRPTVYAVSAQMDKDATNAPILDAAKIVIDLYLLSEHESKLPPIKTVVQRFLQDNALKGMAIERFETDGFVFSDECDLHYCVRITTVADYRAHTFGNLQNEVPIVDEIGIEDDLAEGARITVTWQENDQTISVELPEGATVIDLAFHPLVNVGTHLVIARRGSTTLPPQAELYDKDVITYIQKSDKCEVRASWLIHCKTNRAKKIICSIIQTRLDQN